MLQLMLADRFQLRFHWETHQEPVYLLVADKKGLKLKTTDPGSCVPVPPEVTSTPNGTACGRQYHFNGTHFEGIGMTMKTLAVVLGLSGRPVIDRNMKGWLTSSSISRSPIGSRPIPPMDRLQSSTLCRNSWGLDSSPGQDRSMK